MRLRDQPFNYGLGVAPGASPVACATAFQRRSGFTCFDYDPLELVRPFTPDWVVLSNDNFQVVGAIPHFRMIAPVSSPGQSLPRHL
jgi:hypothetical protein